MIETARLKRFIGVAALGALVVAVIATLAATSLTFVQSRQGADPASALTTIPPVPAEFGALVSWEPDDELVREVEPLTRDLVEAAWVRAWHNVDRAARSAGPDVEDVEASTWFVGNIVDRVAEGATEPSSVTQGTHRLHATFYSLDGSVMGLTARSEIERTAANGLSITGTERFEVVMLLSDGNWRIHQLTRIDTSPFTSG